MCTRYGQGALECGPCGFAAGCGGFVPHAAVVADGLGVIGVVVP